MRNIFYSHPTNDIIVDVEQMYNIHDGVIYVGIEDVHKVVSGAKNVIVLYGKGAGNNRISNALEDAVLHTCTVADGYDLFTAEKIIIKISYPSSYPLMIAEMSEVSQFAEMFTPNINFIWGISETQSSSSDIDVQIIASNLQKK
jgi:cell division protein FtsZ